jgi:hypothetical protein
MNLEIIDSEEPTIITLNDSIPEKSINNLPSSYDIILSKMGMYVENGKISIINKNIQNDKKVKFEIDNNNGINKCSKIKCSRIKQAINQPQQQDLPFTIDNKNSYIHNKYFKNYNENSETINPIPLTKEQIIYKLLERRKLNLHIKRTKSTKLIMPTENIHIAPENNFNRLFGFSKR